MEIAIGLQEAVEQHPFAVARCIDKIRKSKNQFKDIPTGQIKWSYEFGIKCGPGTDGMTLAERIHISLCAHIPRTRYYSPLQIVPKIVLDYYTHPPKPSGQNTEQLLEELRRSPEFFEIRS